MGFNAFAMRLIFLALPGIVGSKVYKKLRGRTNRRRWEDFVEVFLFALASYAIVVIGTGLWQEVWRSEDAAQDGEAVLDAFLDEDLPLDWAAILKATVVSLLLGLAAAYNHTYSLSMRLARWMARMLPVFRSEFMMDRMDGGSPGRPSPLTTAPGLCR